MAAQPADSGQEMRDRAERVLIPSPPCRARLEFALRVALVGDKKKRAGTVVHGSRGKRTGYLY